ncbi:hypothetical protein D3C72_1861090 [compost metagenome]
MGDRVGGGLIHPLDIERTQTRENRIEILVDDFHLAADNQIFGDGGAFHASVSAEVISMRLLEDAHRRLVTFHQVHKRVEIGKPIGAV